MTLFDEEVICLMISIYVDIYLMTSCLGETSCLSLFDFHKQSPHHFILSITTSILMLLVVTGVGL